MPAQPPANPYTDAHYRQMLQALHGISDWMVQVGLAKQAGLPTEEQEQRAIDAKRQVERLKSTYFPSRA
jgi:hypothetical protein